MKHPVKTTTILLFIFLISQFLGIAVVNQYIDHTTSQTTGETSFENLPLGERPEFNPQTAYIPIIIAVLLGTALIFGIIKLGAMKLWKLWFALALFITLTTSLAAFIKTGIAIGIALILVAWRIFKNNPIVHNATEPLVYAGIAAIFVPALNLWSMSILLILISLYDAYAVWQSKHMVTLALAQKDAGIFAGLQIPSGKTKEKTTTKKVEKIQKSKNEKIVMKQSSKLQKKQQKKTSHSAILGGGDIAFPLLLAGVLLKDYSLTAALIMPFFATAALALLFYYSQKGKFYPAMPFISAGCFLGLGFLWMIGLVW